MSRAGYNEKRLLHHLLDNYNVLERPVVNESDPLQLSFGLTLMQIIDVVSIIFCLLSIQFHSVWRVRCDAQNIDTVICGIVILCCIFTQPIDRATILRSICNNSRYRNQIILHLYLILPRTNLVQNPSGYIQEALTTFGSQFDAEK